MPHSHSDRSLQNIQRSQFHSRELHCDQLHSQSPTQAIYKRAESIVRNVRQWQAAWIAVDCSDAAQVLWTSADAALTRWSTKSHLFPMSTMLTFDSANDCTS